MTYRMPTGPLDLSICQTCNALVWESSQPDHDTWHEQLGDLVQVKDINGTVLASYLVRKPTDGQAQVAAAIELASAATEAFDARLVIPATNSTDTALARLADALDAWKVYL